MSNKDCIHVNVCSEELFSSGCDTCKLYEPERTCVLESVKNGALYYVIRFSCCGYEFSESKTDGGSSELITNYCPNCGARVEVSE